MKLKSTNVLMIVSTISCALALVMNIFIYYGPQSTLLTPFFDTVDLEVRVTNNVGTALVALYLIVYLIACVITVRTQKKSSGFMACLLALIIVIIINIGSVYINYKITTSVSANGSKYLAVFSALNVYRNYLEKPFLFLALILLSISLGTLCGQEKIES